MASIAVVLSVFELCAMLAMVEIGWGVYAICFCRFVCDMLCSGHAAEADCVNWEKSNHTRVLECSSGI